MTSPLYEIPGKRKFNPGLILLIVSIVCVFASVLIYLLIYFTDDAGGVSDVRITNIGSNAVTISWITKRPAYAKVFVSETDSWPILTERIGKKEFYDDRDIIQNSEGIYHLNNNAPVARYTHHVTVRNLEPEKTYYFRVGENLRLFTGEQTFFATSKVQETLLPPDPAYGEVVSDDAIIEEGIIYFRIFRTNGNEEVASSFFYSSPLNDTQAWSSDFAYLLDTSERVFSRDKSKDLFDAKVVTNSGIAYRKFSLEAYKPFPPIKIETSTKLESNQLNISSRNELAIIQTLFGPVKACSVWEVTCNNNEHFTQGDCSGGPGSQQAFGSYDNWANEACGPRGGRGGSPQPTQAPNPTGTGGGSCAFGCSRPEGGFWIGASTGNCNVCQNGCGQVAPNQNSCCNLVTPGGEDWNNFGCGGGTVVQPTTTPPPQEGATGGSGSCLSACSRDVGGHWIGATSRDCMICESEGCGKRAANQSLCCDTPGLSSALQVKFGCGPGYNFGPIPTSTPTPTPIAGGACNIECPAVMPSCDGSALISSSNSVGATDINCKYRKGTRQFNYRIKVDRNSCASIEDEEVIGDNLFDIVSCAEYNPPVPTEVSPKPTNTPTPTITEEPRPSPNPTPPITTVIPTNTNPPITTTVVTPTKPTLTPTAVEQPTPQFTPTPTPTAAPTSTPTPTPTAVVIVVPITVIPTQTPTAPVTTGVVTTGVVTTQPVVTTTVPVTTQAPVTTSAPAPTNPTLTPTLPSGGATPPAGTPPAGTPTPGAILNNQLTIGAANVLAAQTQNAENGSYTVKVNGVSVTELKIVAEKAIILYFLDSNNDGIKQDNENYIDTSQIEVTLEQTGSIEGYNLLTGWNLLAFGMVSNEWDMASELIAQINSQDNNVTHVAGFTGNQWQIYSVRKDESGEVKTYGNDFAIIPGAGYFLKSEKTSLFNLEGNKFIGSVPINLDKGWNLVSIHSAEAYTAISLINKCIDQKISCDTVTKFESGRYINLIREGTQNFGNDFGISRKSGLFIRVKEGSQARFTP